MAKNTHTSKIMMIAAAFACAALACACSPGQASTSSEASNPSSTDAGGAFTWAKDSDCGSCHERDTNSFDDAACTAFQHASMKKDCMVCHTDESGLKAAHDKVELGDQKKKAKLKKTTVPEEVCAACHNKAELAEKTASSTVLTDSNGLCVNPHDIPVNDGHAEADIACSSCHKMHEEQNVEETAPKVCLNCHHADVYECNTCHLEK